MLLARERVRAAAGPRPAHARPSPPRPTRAAAAAADRAPAPPESTQATPAPSATDDAEDFGRNGWRRDPRFVRVDFSAQLAARFRRRFVALLSAEGESRARLAELVLVCCAEDDAVAAPTTVPFPVGAWLGRVRRLADGAEVAARGARGAWRRGDRRDKDNNDGNNGNENNNDDDDDDDQDAEGEERAVFAAVERFLFSEQGFSPGDPPAAAAASASWWPRSALGRRRRYDHAGTLEQARRAYLHEVLSRKKGSHPAALALLLADVHARLLMRGATRAPAAVGTGRRWTRVPSALPSRRLTRRAALPAAAPEGAAESDAEDDDDGGEDGKDASARRRPWPLAAFPAFDPLLELLRHLKRAYWPFLWDTNADADEDENEDEAEANDDNNASPLPLPPSKISHGGFVGAAKAALGEDDNAALRVVSAAAKHRLERGIFTSPGAGDIRRCLAASERVVLMLDARSATAADARAHAANLALERRDLGALLLHSGRFDEAAAELGAYAEARARDGTSAGGASSSSSSFSLRGGGGGSRLEGVRRPWEGASSSSSSSSPPSSSSSSTSQGGGGARWDTAFEAALADRLLELARAGRRDGSPLPPPLTVQRALLAPEGEGGGAGAGGGGAEPQRHTW